MSLVNITKTGGDRMVPFSDIPTPGLFEHGGRLYVRTPDSAQKGSSTILNAFRLHDLQLTGFLPDDMVYRATVEPFTIRYSTISK